MSAEHESRTCATVRVNVKKASACVTLNSGAGARTANWELIHTIPIPIVTGTWNARYIARELCSSSSDSMPNPTSVKAHPM